MRFAAALLALSCAAHHVVAVRRAQLQAPSVAVDLLHADSFLFAGSIDTQFSCLVLTDLDDGGSDTLRTAVGDPRCVRIAVAAGLTVALTRPLVVTRSLRIECDYAASVVAPLVPPAPRAPVWDSLGGAPPLRAATGAAGVADNSTLVGALPGACALDGGGVTRLITMPRTAPSGLRVNITNIIMRNGFADGSGPQDGGGAIFLAVPSSLMLLDHVTFVNNSATNGGAVLLANTSALIALACRFTDNVRALAYQALHARCRSDSCLPQRAVGVGGAIAAFNAELALTKSWVERSVSGQGAVAALQGTNLQVQFTVFVDNVGGALVIGPQATTGQAALVSFSRFTRNSAPGDGGAILAFGARPTGGARLALRLVHCEFQANTAARFGGALATRGGVSTDAEHCDFAANTDICSADAPLGGAAYINIGAGQNGSSCSDVLTVHDGKPDCHTWTADALAHQSTSQSWRPQCVPLEVSLPWGPFCCSPSLAAPLGCPLPPVVVDLPQLLCPAP